MGIFSRLSGKDARAANAFTAISPWLAQYSITEESIHFQVYENPGLARNRDATVLVGSGISSVKGYVGFVIEISPFGRILETVFLEPEGVASWHARCAEIARGSGRPLMDVMLEAAEEFRKRRGN